MNLVIDYLFFIPLVFVICLIYNSLKRERIKEIFGSAVRSTIYLTLGVTIFSIALYIFMEIVLS